MELAYRVGAAEPVTVEHIAERRHIPKKFLIHILLQLKRAGIVRSLRGARGGYLLARAPEDVSLLDIVSAIDGPILTPLPVKDAGSSDMAPVWREAARGVADVLRQHTVKDMIERGDRSSMYYI